MSEVQLTIWFSALGSRLLARDRSPVASKALAEVVPAQPTPRVVHTSADYRPHRCPDQVTECRRLTSHRTLRNHQVLTDAGAILNIRDLLAAECRTGLCR
jgi:hypothetical protein